MIYPIIGLHCFVTQVEQEVNAWYLLKCSFEIIFPKFTHISRQVDENVSTTVVSAI